MTYPLDSLVYIAPILFIVMMVAFPVIGVFGGWKRAAYWGGGNFIFYIIGMLIWTFAGSAISAPLVNLIKGIIGQDIDADFTKIAASVLAPIWFIIVLFIGNIILLINYYAWFKRVAGLSKYKTIKKTSKNGTITKTKVLVQHNYSTRYKAMSMVVGGVGMGALMLPTTFAMTNAVFFTTTSPKTRATNPFAAGVYKATVGTDSTVDWFSYYSGSTDSAVDYDALFAALDMNNTEIIFETPEGKQEPETLIEALEDTFDYGLGGINGTTMGYDEATGDDDRKEIIEAVKYMTNSWNKLMDQAEWAMTALFNSSNATAIVTQLVSKLASPEAVDEGLKLTSESIWNYLPNPAQPEKTPIFRELLELYQDPNWRDENDIPDIHQVNVNQRSYDNMVDAIANLYEWEDGLKEQYYDGFRACMYDLMGLMFY